MGILRGVDLCMKTKLLTHLFGALLMTAMLTAFAPAASADGKDNGNEKCYSGTITSLDAKDQTVRVRGYLFSKSFVLANNCALKQWDKNGATLGDFRPGQRVQVSYKDASGVLVADRLSQEALRFSGTVAGMDVNKHTLTVHHRGMDRTFMLAGNYQVLQNGKSSQGMDNVKWGDRVTVVYEVPGDQMLARQIELPGMVFTGSLDAINLDDRSISAGKRYLNDQKFRLADDCVIIANGKADGRMSDLRLGRNYELNYESVGGINVVNRIAPADTAAKTEAPTHTAQTIPPEE